MDLLTFYNNPEDSDVLIIHPKGQIYAHKIILKTRSKVLASMLQVGFKEADNHQIDLSAFSSSSVEFVIRYCYQKELLVKSTISLNKLEQLIHLGDFLDLKDFTEELSKYMISTNYDTNKILSIILKYRLNSVYSFISDICTKNVDVVQKLSYDDYFEMRKHLQTPNLTIHCDIIWCDYNDETKFEIFANSLNITPSILGEFFYDPDFNFNSDYAKILYSSFLRNNLDYAKILYSYCLRTDPDFAKILYEFFLRDKIDLSSDISDTISMFNGFESLFDSLCGNNISFQPSHRRHSRQLSRRPSYVE